MGRATVHVDIDAADVAAVVERAVRAVQPPVITGAVATGARRYQDGARARAPKRSGRLAGSIGYRTTGAYSAETSTDLIYAQITEFGGVHRPVSAKVLRFDAGGGVVFRARSVNPAQPYWLPTFDQDTDAVAEAVMDYIGDFIGI